jgi:hypothetical protein
MVAIILALPLVCLAVPPELALPTVSVLLLVTGFGVAGGAYLAGHQAVPDRIGARDVAGSLVLLGFAAALLSEDEQALALLERLHAGVVASGQM